MRVWGSGTGAHVERGPELVLGVAGTVAVGGILLESDDFHLA